MVAKAPPDTILQTNVTVMSLKITSDGEVPYSSHRLSISCSTAGFGEVVSEPKIALGFNVTM